MTGIIVDVALDSSKAEQGLNKINNNLKDMSKSATSTGHALDKSMNPRSMKDIAESTRKTSVSFKDLGVAGPKALDAVANSASKANAKIDETSSVVGELVAALALIGTAGVAVNYMDDFTRLSNRINLVVKDTNELIDVQAKLFAISTKNRAGLEGTTETYFQFSRALKNTGIEQSRLLSVTDTIAKAIAVSGATAESAKAGLIQLGQGLSAGALRGDEFNSVLENIPVVAEAINKGLGTTIGQLRSLAETGQLTTDKIFKAIEGGATDIGSSFAKTAATAGQGFTQLNNVLLVLAGNFNSTFNVSSKIYDTLAASAVSLNSIGTSMINYLSTGVDEVNGYLNESSFDNIKKAFSTVKTAFSDFNSGELIDTKYGISIIDQIIAKIPSKVKNISTAFGAVTGLFAANPVGDAQSGLGKMFGDMSGISSVAKSIGKVIDTITSLRISMGEAYGVLTTFIYAITGSFHAFELIMPRIRGPVITVNKQIEASFIRLQSITKGVVDSNLFSLARGFTGLTEEMSFFILANTRTERAFADIAHSSSLAELMKNLTHLGDVLRSSRPKTFAADFEALRSIFQGVGVSVQSTLIALGLMDQRLISITGIKPLLLQQFFKTTGDAISILYNQILIPKLTPVIGAIKANVYPIVGAYKDAIVALIKDLDAREMGKSVGEALKSAFKYAGSLLSGAGIDLSSIFTMKSLNTVLDDIYRFIKAASIAIYNFFAGVAQGFGLTDKMENAFNAINKGADKAVTSFKKMVDEVIAYGKKLYSQGFKGIAQFGEDVASVFYVVWDKVVGHSYWPDMVDGVINKAKDLTQADGIVRNFTNSVVGYFKNLAENKVDIFASMKNSAKDVLTYISTTFYPLLVQVGTVVAGLIAEIFLPAKFGIIAIVGLFGEAIAATFSSKQQNSISTYFGDVGAEAAKRFGRSFIAGIDLIMSVIPEAVASGFSKLGFIGNEVGKVINMLPKPIAVALIAAFGFATLELAKKIPKLLMNDLLIPLSSGITKAVALAAGSSKIGTGLFSALLALPKSTVVLTAVLSLLAMFTSTVTAVSATISGIPLIYLLLLGNKGTNKFATQIATMVVPVLGTAFKKLLGKSMTDWFDTNGLVTNLKKVFKNIGTIILSSMPRSTNTINPLSPIIKSLQTASGEIGKVIKNIRKNWQAYIADGSTMDIFGLMFGSRIATQMRNRQAFADAFSNLATEIKAGVVKLWTAFSATSAGQSFASGLGNFKTFFSKLNILVNDGLMSIGKLAIRLAGSFTTAFPAMSAAVASFASKAITAFAPLGGSWKTILLTLGKLAIISFIGVASAADGTSSSVGNLVTSMLGFAIAIKVALTALRLLRVATDIKEMMAMGMTFTLARRAALQLLVADTTHSFVQIKNIVNTIWTSIMNINWSSVWSGLVTASKFAWKVISSPISTVFTLLKSIWNSGILGNLVRGFWDLGKGLFYTLTNAPGQAAALARSFGSFGGILARIIPFLFSWAGILTVATVAAVGFMAVGLFGDDSFAVNIGKAVDKLAIMIGIMEKPINFGIGKQIQDMFSHLGTTGTEADFTKAIANVNFDKASNSQTANLVSVSQETKEALKEANRLFVANGKLTEDQLKKVTDAVNKQKETLNAMPQRVAIDMVSANEELITEMQKSTGAFVAIKNLYNSSMLSDMVGSTANFLSPVTKAVGTIFSLLHKYTLGLVVDLYDSVTTGLSNGFNNSIDYIKEKWSGLGDWFVNTDIGKRMFPNRDRQNMLPNLLANKPKLTNEQLSTTESDNIGRITQDYQRMYHEINNGATRTTAERIKLEKMFFDKGNELRAAQKDAIDLTKIRKDFVEADKLQQTFSEKWASSISMAAKEAQGPIGMLFGGIAKATGALDWLDKYGLAIERVATKSQISASTILKARELVLTERYKTGKITNTEAVAIRVELTNLNQSGKDLQELAANIASIPKRIELFTNISGLEVTQKGLATLMSAYPQLAKQYSSAVEEMVIAKTKLNDAMANKDLVSTDVALQQKAIEGINDARKQLTSKEKVVTDISVQVRPILATNEFDAVNNQLKAIGQSEYSVEVFLAVHGNNEVTGIKNALESVKLAMKNLDNGSPLFLEFLKESKILTDDLARAAKKATDAFNPNKSTADALGVKEIQFAGVKDATAKARMIELSQTIESLSTINTLGRADVENQKDALTYRKAVKELATLKTKVGLDAETKGSIAKTAKEAAKTWVDYFNESTKALSLTVDPAMFIKASKQVQDEVIKLSADLRKANAGAKPSDKEKKLGMGMSDANKKSALDAVRIAEEIKRVLDEANTTIGDLESNYATIYDSFTFEKLSLVTPEMQTMIDDYLLTAKKIAELKLNAKNDPKNTELPKVIGALEKVQTDRKDKFNVLTPKSYGEMQSASGLDSKVYNQLTIDIQDKMATVGNALKVAMDELAKSTNASPEVVKGLKNNVKLAQDAVERAKPRTYNDMQSASGIDPKVYDKLTTDVQLSVDKVAFELKLALDTLANSVNSSPEVFAQAKADAKQKRKELDEATAAAFSNSSSFDKTAQALKTAGINVDNGLRKATDAQLETMRNLAIDIAKAEVEATDATSEALRVKAQEIIDSKSEQLNLMISEAKVPAAETAGKAFADNITNSFSSGLKSIFSAEKSVGDVFKDIALNFAKGVTDTVADGLIKGFMGNGKDGGFAQMLAELGAGLFGGAASIGADGSSEANALWVQMAGGGTGAVFGDGTDPVAKAGGGIMDGIKGIWGKITGKDTGNGTGYDSAGGAYAMLPDSGTISDYENLTGPITDAVSQSAIDINTAATDNFGGLGGLFSQGINGLVNGISGLFGGSGGFDIGGIFGSIKGFFGFSNGGFINGKVSGAGHGTSDSISAKLSNGEYVVNAKATKANKRILDAINYGKPTAFATGGLVGGVSAIAVDNRNESMGLTSKAKSTNQTFHINVTGDISKQTRKEIQMMIPQITMGVNSTNRENGGR